MATVERGDRQREDRRARSTARSSSLGPSARHVRCRSATAVLVAATPLGAAACRAAVRGMPRKPPQLHQLQPERFNSRDEAVQCSAVDDQADQRGLGSLPRSRWSGSGAASIPGVSRPATRKAYSVLTMLCEVWWGVSEDIIGETE